jgi:hypothetical protein
MLFNKIWVKKAMGRAGINEGLDHGSGSGVGGNEKSEGVGEKSGRIESDLVSRTGGSNAALSPYGGGRTAYYFFESIAFALDLSSVALAPRAFVLEAEDVALVQSFAMCPPLPQNRHRLPSMRRWHSCGVSLPSLPSFSGRSDVLFLLVKLFEDPELLVVLPELEEPELPGVFFWPELSDFLSDLLFDLFIFSDDFSALDVEAFSWEILEWRSQ